MIQRFVAVLGVDGERRVEPHEVAGIVEDVLVETCVRDESTAGNPVEPFLKAYCQRNSGKFREKLQSPRTGHVAIFRDSIVVRVADYGDVSMAEADKLTAAMYLSSQGVLTLPGCVLIWYDLIGGEPTMVVKFYWKEGRPLHDPPTRCDRGKTWLITGSNVDHAARVTGTSAGDGAWSYETLCGITYPAYDKGVMELPAGKSVSCRRCDKALKS